MRHGKKGNKLSRTASHRRALLMNLGCQLITYKRITTTLAKAKALRTYIEPLITKTKSNASKEAIMHNHRIVFSYLNDKAAVKELFTVVAPKIAARPHMAAYEKKQVDHSQDAINAASKNMQSDAPACNVCGHITIRSGTCYKCLNCGNSMGCS